jgi:hypothetical protein
MLGFGGTAFLRRPQFQRLDEFVVDIAYDKLAHRLAPCLL